MLRQSRWTYPLVNAGHVLGVALLVGAVTPMALRLMGLWRDVEVAVMLRILRPMAAGGTALAIASGAMLFAVQATDYAQVTLFAVKMGLVVLGLAHALSWGTRLAAAPPARQRLAGALSLGVWLSVLVCGRMIGYL